MRVGQLSQIVYDRLSRHRSCTIKILIYHRDWFTIHFILSKKKNQKKKKKNFCKLLLTDFRHFWVSDNFSALKLCREVKYMH